jgi:cell division protein FtsQ
MNARRPTPVPRSNERERRKPRRSRARGYFKAVSVNGRLPAFLLSVGLSVLVFGFLFSSDFPVRVVVVEGNKVAYADSIVERSGAMGQSVFTLDTGEVARRVAQHPAVASADVHAELPDTIVVKVTERIPVLVWQTGDQAVLVDEHGGVIATGDDKSLPRVIQTSGKGPIPGDQLPADIVQAATYLTKQMGSSLSALGYDSTTGLTAQLSNGRTVVLGSGDRIPLKLSVMSAALKMSEQWSRLDVREPDRPFYQ